MRAMRQLVVRLRMTNKLQMAMFPPVSEWLPPDTFPDITDAKEIAIDVETRDPDLKTHGPGWARNVGEVVGVAVAVDGWKTYIPLRHLGGGNLDERVVSKWLKRVFECPADKIMHNAQYDAGWIRRMGFNINGRIIDTMMTAGLLDENRFSYSLNALSYEHLGKVKSEKTLSDAAREFGLDPKAELWKLPAHFVGPYAETDAELTLELWRNFVPKLNTEDLWSVHKLEADLLPCLIDMTWNGVRVDIDRAETTKQELLKREKSLLRKIKKVSGQEVEIWAATSVAKAFDSMSVSYPKTEKGNPSFTKTFLSEHPSEIAQLIVEAREINKTHSTFINTILRHVSGAGRIHAHINQLRSDDGGTVSGRISMSTPNLQQVPHHGRGKGAEYEEYGKRIRGCLVARSGYVLVAADVGQQEPRIASLVAPEPTLMADFKKGRTPYALIGEDIYGREIVKGVDEQEWHTAKTFFLALVYGAGAGKLKEIDPRLTMEQSRRGYDRVVGRYGGLAKFQTKVASEIYRNGYARDWFGRVRWFPGIYSAIESQRQAALREAINFHIQGPAASCIKIAMRSLWDGIHDTGLDAHLLLQVHDEVILEVRESQLDSLIKEVDAMLIDVMPIPFPVEPQVGVTWAEMIPYE